RASRGTTATARSSRLRFVPGASQPLLDDLYELPVRPRIGKERSQLTQRAHEFRQIEEVDAMPRREIEIEGARHDPAFGSNGAVAQRGHDPLRVDARVEVGSAI